MKRFIETPVFHILCTLFDLVVINLLYVLCSLPIVTIGASSTALYAALFALFQDEAHIYTLFLRTFFPLLSEKHDLLASLASACRHCLRGYCDYRALLGFLWEVYRAGNTASDSVSSAMHWQLSLSPAEYQ